MAFFLVRSTNLKECRAYSFYLFKKKVKCKRAPDRSFGGITEEGIVIIGDDSSVPVTAPEDLPVGQDMEVDDSDI
ncbi:hypothetical protein AAY473_022780, partial [Plecturocebus cupreus]